jgi:hypothetical protein
MCRCWTCAIAAPMLVSASTVAAPAGPDHLPNALLFYWLQSYASAANIYLLNEYSDYINIGAVDEATITRLVSEYCKSNPNQKPITAIDKLIGDARKVDAKEADAFDPWEH